MRTLALLICLMAALLIFAISYHLRRQRSTMIQLTHQRQGHNLCVPTCASMVLASYGELRTPVEMKVLAASADPQFPGTYFRDMIAGVAKLGYHWHEETYPLTRVGFRRGIKQVRSSLNSGYPVLVGVSHPPIGHTVVVVGYDEKLSRIHLMDPELEEPGTRTLSYEEFEREWRENIIDIRAAIFTKPRR